MYVTVKCNQSLIVGQVVAYSSSSDQWEVASSLSEEISIVKSNPENNGTDESPEYVCKITVSGPAYCTASRDIPVQGGELNVENGKVFVDNSLNQSWGFIVPKDINEADRVTDSIIKVVLR
jgi:hypothetical protein